VLGGTSLVAVTATGGSGGFTFTGGSGADSITGGSGVDALIGGSGNDTINGGAGVDAITGGTGGDSLTGGSGVDTFTQGATDGVAPSATSFAGATVAAADTLTFSSTAGVDVITDFTAGSGGDVLALPGVVATLATGIGVAVANTGFVTTTTAYYLSGVYTASTGTFTVLADGVGNSTLVLNGVATTTLAANTTMAILVGVNSAGLVAANFS
jgi:Ca2+-binding RTX toxin-like protein